jgi:copper homeostasis protein (lipoprotein)
MRDRRRDFGAACKGLGIALACGGAFLGCGPRPQSERNAEASAEAPPAASASGAAVFAIYEGTLPCADCGGIRTELTLFASEGRFALRETYLATKDGDRVVESSGTWTTEHGSGSDSASVVYVLDTGDAQTSRKLIAASEREIELLDREGKRIVSDLNYKLARKDAALEAR